MSSQFSLVRFSSVALSGRRFEAIRRYFGNMGALSLTDNVLVFGRRATAEHDGI